jgi:hypothetical protein
MQNIGEFTALPQVSSSPSQEMRIDSPKLTTTIQFNLPEIVAHYTKIPT